MKAPTLYELPTYRPAGGVQETAKRRFVWIPVDVMESPAWCSLSINARRIIDRLLLENFRHMGVENGKLRVSVRQFAECGVNTRFACDAIAELVAGRPYRCDGGRRQGEVFAPPNVYRITFHGTLDDGPTWAAASQKEATCNAGGKIFLAPPKGKAGAPPKGKTGKADSHPQKVQRGSQNHRPPKGPSIYNIFGGWAVGRMF